MNTKVLQSIKYVISRFLLRKKFLVATADNNAVRLKFKIEDVVGRHIYKRGEYEKHLSDYISNHVVFNEGDIALDVGANIGWYSLLLARLMPSNSTI